MGHRSIQVTIDVYGHLIRGENVVYLLTMISLANGRSRFRLTAPPVELGDPRLYVLVETVGRRADCIETVNFRRLQDGRYDSYASKCAADNEFVKRTRHKIMNSKPLSGGLLVCK